jgi:hypothetical protein
VVHREQHAPALAQDRAVDLRDLRAVREVAERMAAERHDQARTDQGELDLQPRHVVGHLVGTRIAVAGRAGLDDVGDVDLLAIEPGRRQQLVQQPPRAAHERPALLVLAGAGRLADDHHVGRRAALPWHHVRRRLARFEPAAVVAAYLTM